MQDRDDDRDFEPRGRERRRERGPGLGLTALGAGLLTAVGFVLGIVVGASFEDPDLLVSSLAGRTQDVELGAAQAPAPVAAAPPPLGAAGDAPAAQADFAAVPPVEEAEAPATGAGEAPVPLGAGVELPAVPAEAPAAPPPPPPRAEPPKRATPTRVAAAPSGRFSVQVGAFQDRPPAAALSDRLERSGFPAYVAAGESGSGQRWRVRVGPVSTRGEADQLARRLKREEGLPTWVVADGR